MKHQPVKQGQTTTLGTLCPTLCEKCVGSLMFPANQYREGAGDRAYGLSSLSEKTRTSNHLQMSVLILITLPASTGRVDAYHILTLFVLSFLLLFQ